MGPRHHRAWAEDRAGDLAPLDRNCDPFARQVAALPKADRSRARAIFNGKPVEVRRRENGGFAKGTVLIPEPDPGRGREPEQMQIESRDEVLTAQAEEWAPATKPGLIRILDAETDESIATEELRYGQRVKVMGVRVLEIMRTPEALKVWGPGYFGFDVPYEAFA